MADVVIPTPPDKEAEEASLEASLAGVVQPGGDARCSVTDLLGWCQSASVRLFAGDAERTLTDWGLRTFRTVLLAALDNRELLSTTFVRWVQENILPCLVPVAPASVPNHELTYLLVQCLLQRLTEAPATGAPATKRRRCARGGGRVPARRSGQTATPGGRTPPSTADRSSPPA